MPVEGSIAGRMLTLSLRLQSVILDVAESHGSKLPNRGSDARYRIPADMWLGDHHTIHGPGTFSVAQRIPDSRNSHSFLETHAIEMYATKSPLETS